MNIIFENKTIYSPEEYKKFQEFHSEKYSFSYLATTAFITFLLVFLCMGQFMAKQFLVGILLLLSIPCFLLWRKWHPSYFNKKEANSKKIKDNMMMTFSFFPYYFYANNGKQKRRCYYLSLYRIFETKENFYLYTNYDYAFVLSKDNFTIGNYEDFLSFIKRKAPFKYKK